MQARSTWLVLVGAALSLTGGGCSGGTDREGCVNSQECASGEQCVSGQCLAAKARECREDTECGADRYCDLGVCRDRQAQANNNNQNNTETGCESDPQCTAPSVCENKQCVPGCASPGSSITCATGERCNAARGRCEPATAGCAQDSECGAPASVCEGGQCVRGCTEPGGLACSGGFVCSASTGRCAPPAGTPCGADPECGAPAAVCEARQCVPGCSTPGGVQCSGANVCDTNTGRCRAVSGSCTNDSGCGAPAMVCEGGQCVPGCGQPGGVTCSGATQCNQGSGRCDPFNVPCGTDAQCAPPSTICQGGMCVAGCAASGCSGGLVCGTTSGRCETPPPVPTCVEDSLEQNDTRATAHALTAGSYSSLGACASDDDWYAITLAAGDQITVETLFSNAEGDVDLELVDPSGQNVATSASTTDNERVTHTAAGAGSYRIHVWLYRDAGSTPGNGYSMTVTVVPSGPPPPPPPPPACGPDALEENDTQASAAAFTPGRRNGLSVCGGDDDYYAITLQAGDQLTVDALFSSAEGDIDLRLLSPSGASEASALGTGSNEHLEYAAMTAGTYVLRVNLYADAGSNPGNTYDLSAAVSAVCPSDPEEDNDSASTARPLSIGTMSSLTACDLDDDYFRVTLAAGQQISVSARFTHAEGDIDLAVLDAAGDVIGGSISSSDDESVSFSAPSAGTYYIVLYLYGDLGARPGNFYSLQANF